MTQKPLCTFPDCGLGAATYVPTSALPWEWTELLGGYTDCPPPKFSTDRLTGLCQKHFRLARSKTGLLLGYRYWQGKITRYVLEEFLGGGDAPANPVKKSRPVKRRTPSPAHSRSRPRQPPERWNTFYRVASPREER